METENKRDREYRLDHGLCPICGKDAAPYYLCFDHRVVNSLRRLLNRMTDAGLVVKSKDGHRDMWKAAPGVTEQSFENWDWPTYLLDMDPDDKRLHPRLGRMPVDLIETLRQILVDAARPLTVDEIILAWGKLRSRRKTSSLAGDMTRLIKAQRKRDMRKAKRNALIEDVA